MATEDAPANDYDTVELRTGRLRKIRRSEARMLGEDDRMVQVVKCYCRTHDVLTAADADLQQRPTFVFPAQFFGKRQPDTVLTGKLTPLCVHTTTMWTHSGDGGFTLGRVPLRPDSRSRAAGPRSG